MLKIRNKKQDHIPATHRCLHIGYGIVRSCEATNIVRLRMRIRSARASGQRPTNIEVVYLLRCRGFYCLAGHRDVRPEERERERGRKMDGDWPRARAYILL